MLTDARKLSPEAELPMIRVHTPVEDGDRRAALIQALAAIAARLAREGRQPDMQAEQEHAA